MQTTRRRGANYKSRHASRSRPARRKGNAGPCLKGSAAVVVPAGLQGCLPQRLIAGGAVQNSWVNESDLDG
ncbi:hypothetical protein R6Z07F_009623 [Ovis aries]